MTSPGFAVLIFDYDFMLHSLLWLGVDEKSRVDFTASNFSKYRLLIGWAKLLGKAALIIFYNAPMMNPRLFEMVEALLNALQSCSTNSSKPRSGTICMVAPDDYLQQFPVVPYCKFMENEHGTVHYLISFAGYVSEGLKYLGAYKGS